MHLPSLIDWLAEHRGDFDGIVSDMDGVLILGRTQLPGSARLLELLDEWGLPCMLLTNDGSRSKQERSDLIGQCGLSVPAHRIVTSSDGIYELLDDYPDYRGKRFYVYGRLGTPCYAETAGLEVTRDLDQLPTCCGVVAGEGRRAFDWEAIFTGCINFFAQHPGAPFIVPNPDHYYSTGKGELHVGAGGQARFIQSVLETHGTPCTLHFLGKPHRPIFQHVHHELERLAGHAIDPRRVLMMGDNLHGDIEGGNAFGYRTALLLTGITHLDKLAASQVRPELVAERL